MNDLLEKSEEAYLLAIEIINKPTILYRTEGFCFFICNAWELLLKAHIVKTTSNPSTIFYKDKVQRTLSFTDVLEKVFTSTNHPVKNSLQIIYSIRNRSTHFVLKEYDYDLAPLYQGVVLAFKDFFERHFSDYSFNENVTPFIAINSTKRVASNTLNIVGDGVEFLKNIKNEMNKEGLGINYQFIITKKEIEADFKVSIDNDATQKAIMLKVPKDVNALFPFSYTNLFKSIVQSLETALGPSHGFSKKSLDMITKDLKAKENKGYAYVFDYTSKSQPVKYSQDYLNFIVANFIDNIEFRTKYQRKKDN